MGYPCLHGRDPWCMACADQAERSARTSFIDLAGARARIAALESQVAALAGASWELCREFRETLDHRINHDHYEQWVIDKSVAILTAAEDSLTADAQHLAQLDAARREVCAAAERIYAAIRAAVPGVMPLDPLVDLRAALDALAKLEGR